ncbi:MAG: hypothetical protein DBX61_04830, partial [Clostridiales bacterium]
MIYVFLRVCTVEFMPRKRALARERFIRCFYLLVRERCSGSQPPAFLSEKSGVKELDFMFYSEFVRWRLCRTNG